MPGLLFQSKSPVSVTVRDTEDVRHPDVVASEATQEHTHTHTEEDHLYKQPDWNISSLNSHTFQSFMFSVVWVDGRIKFGSCGSDGVKGHRVKGSGPRESSSAPGRSLFIVNCSLFCGFTHFYLLTLGEN